MKLLSVVEQQGNMKLDTAAPLNTPGKSIAAVSSPVSAYRGYDNNKPHPHRTAAEMETFPPSEGDAKDFREQENTETGRRCRKTREARTLL